MPVRLARPLLSLLVCLAAAALVAAPGAPAAETFPSITDVSPAKAGVGDTLVLTGKGFRSGKNRNTVVFKRDGGRAVFVKAAKATVSKITIVVPDKLLPFMVQRSGKPVATRFRVRVLAKRFGKRYTSRAASPLIGPVSVAPQAPVGDDDFDDDGILNAVDPDDDNDLLPDTLEQQVGLRADRADTDGDGVSDGFEYYSALDLNSIAVPYPGKKPYPNPLDSGDAHNDFDGDSLTLTEEYAAWKRTGGTLPLSYSDGTQYTGGKVAVTGEPDIDSNGWLSDEEKDVDGDGLSNFDEAHGPLSSETWWTSVFTAETEYPGPAYAPTNFIDPDTDGDGVLDGADDQDHDGYDNVFETSRPFNWATTYVSIAHAGTDPLARVQPFNPCKPIYSDLCHTHAPLGYYQPNEDWESPVHAPYP